MRLIKIDWKTKFFFCLSILLGLVCYTNKHFKFKSRIINILNLKVVTSKNSHSGSSGQFIPDTEHKLHLACIAKDTIRLFGRP